MPHGCPIPLGLWIARPLSLASADQVAVIARPYGSVPGRTLPSPRPTLPPAAPNRAPDAVCCDRGHIECHSQVLSGVANCAGFCGFQGQQTMNLGTLLPRHARCRGDHVAVQFEDQRYTFREFNLRVNKLANALRALGLRKGDKIATILPNCLEQLEVYWAAAKTGLVAVPMSPLLQEAGLTSLLTNSDARLVISTGALATVLAKVREALTAIGADRWIMTEATSLAGFRSYGDLVEQASSDEPPHVDISPSDPYNIIYSSGTTGEPKGIVHTHGVRAGYATMFASAFRMSPESVCLHPGSLVFNGAFLDLMPAMYLGCTYITHRAFEARRVIEEIERSAVTHTIMVPSQIVALLNDDGFAPARLRSLEMLQSVGHRCIASIRID